MRFSTIFVASAAAGLAVAESSAVTTYTQTRTVLRVVATTTMTRSATASPSDYPVVTSQPWGYNSTAPSSVASTGSLPSSTGGPLPPTNGASSLSFGLVQVAALAGIVGLVVV